MFAPPYEPEGTLCAPVHVVTAVLIRAFKAGMEERVPIWTIIISHSAPGNFDHNPVGFALSGITHELSQNLRGRNIPPSPRQPGQHRPDSEAETPQNGQLEPFANIRPSSLNGSAPIATPRQTMLIILLLILFV
jgi:hypothetical protein